MKKPDAAYERVAWHPTVDILEEADRVVVTCDLPGVTRDQVDIRFHNGLLTISGERQLPGRKGWARRERPRGTFGRSFPLAGLFDVGRLSASLRHGVLTVVLPRRAGESTRPIKVPVE